MKRPIRPAVCRQPKRCDTCLHWLPDAQCPNTYGDCPVDGRGRTLYYHGGDCEDHRRHEHPARQGRGFDLRGVSVAPFDPGPAPGETPKRRQP